MYNLYQSERSRPEVQSSAEFEEYLSLNRKYLETKIKLLTIHNLYEYDINECKRIIKSNTVLLSDTNPEYKVKYFNRLGIVGKTRLAELRTEFLTNTFYENLMDDFEDEWETLERQKAEKQLIKDEYEKKLQSLIDKKEKIKQELEASFSDIVDEIMRSSYQKRSYCKLNVDGTYTMNDYMREEIKRKFLIY